MTRLKMLELNISDLYDRRYRMRRFQVGKLRATVRNRPTRRRR